MQLPRTPVAICRLLPGSLIAPFRMSSSLRYFPPHGAATHAVPRTPVSTLFQGHLGFLLVHYVSMMRRVWDLPSADRFSTFGPRFPPLSRFGVMRRTRLECPHHSHDSALRTTADCSGQNGGNFSPHGSRWISPALLPAAPRALDDIPAQTDIQFERFFLGIR